jgi:hypothetical protein
MAKSTKVKTAAATPAFEFVGPPRRLVAVGDVPTLEGPIKIDGPLSMYVPQERQAVRSRGEGRRASGATLRLAANTPAGDYKGTLSAEKQVYAVTARVLPETKVSILAGELALVGPLGQRATTTMAIANQGNTEIRFPRAIPIALFDDDGLETAFATSYAKPRNSFDDFFAAFHGKLSESHSGILKLVITRGHGIQKPGTSFSVDFALDILKPLRSGRRYHGFATTDFADFPITLSVTSGVVS